MTERLRNVQLHVERLISSDKRLWCGFATMPSAITVSTPLSVARKGRALSSAVETDAVELECVLDCGIGAI